MKSVVCIATLVVLHAAIQVQAVQGTDSLCKAPWSQPEDCCATGNASSTNVYFFEVTVPRTGSAHWPDQSPLSNAVKNPLAELLPMSRPGCTRVPRRISHDALNFSQSFETIVIRVNTSDVPCWQNQACQAAAWYVRNIMQENTTTLIRDFRSTWTVENTTMDYVPVKIPEYLRKKLRPNKWVFWVQGCIGGIIMIAQIAFQAHNYFTTDFRFMQEEDE